MKKVQITETVLRDANQSLMATRLPYSDFADILPEMNKAGYYSVECWGGATFDSCLRYLGEDPWQRLRDIRKAMPDTKLQMLLRGQNLLGYKHYHDDVVEKFVELSIKNGIDILRIFDALNDFRNIATALEATKKYATKNNRRVRLHLLHAESGPHGQEICRDVQGTQDHGLRHHLPEGHGRHHEPV